MHEVHNDERGFHNRNRESDVDIERSKVNVCRRDRDNHQDEKGKADRVVCLLWNNHDIFSLLTDRLEERLIAAHAYVSSQS
jgi:hypothetical protein